MGSSQRIPLRLLTTIIMNSQSQSRPQNNRNRSSRRRRQRAPRRSTVMTMTNRTTFRTHTAFGERYRTTIEQTFSAFFAAGTLAYSGSTGISYCNILANSIVTPFNTTTYTYVPTSVYFPVTTCAGTSINNAPLGYQQLSALYMQYRVHRAKLRVSCVLQQATDNVELSLIALGNEPIPSASAANVTTPIMCSQPYSRHKAICYLMDNPVVTIDMPIHRILGLTQAEYLNGNWINMGNQPVNNYALFGVHLQSQGNSGNGAKVCLTMTLTLDVELNGLLNPIN